MTQWLKFLLAALLALLVSGAGLSAAESTSPYERHDRYHRMADDSHVSGKKGDDAGLKCDCPEKHKDDDSDRHGGHGKHDCKGHCKHECKGHTDKAHKHGDCGKCGRHGGCGHHDGKGPDDLEELFR